MHMARTARQTFLDPADVYFREQSAQCLAIARARPLPTEQAGVLRLTQHWQNAADASDISLREADDEDTGSFTVALR
jgi:hypothetical protein